MRRSIIAAGVVAAGVAALLIVPKHRENRGVASDRPDEPARARATDDAVATGLSRTQPDRHASPRAADPPEPGMVAGPTPGLPITGTALTAPLSYAIATNREAAVVALRQWAEDGRRAASSFAAKTGMPMQGVHNNRPFTFIAIRNGRIYRYTTHNVDAAISTAADLVRRSPPYYLDGSGITVGIWDAGSVRATHREFGNRISLRDSAAVHYHSTHVAGTIGANGLEPNAEGMAPQVSIDSYDWDSDAAEMAAAGRADPGESGVIEISNHSYGLQTGWEGTEWFGTWATHNESDGFGLYDVYASQWDAVCYNTPYYLPFNSAGNDRIDNAPSPGSLFTYFDGAGWQSKAYDPATDPPADGWDRGGYDTISYIGNAKNIMTVGAVSDAVSGTRDLGRATMTSFSGWGPSDDGRVKPDIVGNGAGLWSTYSSHDASYAVLSGTSMSAPNTAGSAALLVDLYRLLFPGKAMRASMLKGLIIHTADDLGNAGPDYQFGWGLMNTKAAADHISAHHSHTNAQRMVEGRVSAAAPEIEHSFLWNGVTPISATLCWTDFPGSARNSLDNRAPALVHDLDLRIVSPSGQTNYPYRLDPLNPDALATTGDNHVDNVEVVRVLSPPEAGAYRAVVSLDSALLAAEQVYSLLISGGTVPPDIQHTPIENTTNSVSPYRVTATIYSDTALVAGQTLLHYRTGGTGSVFQSTQLVPVTGTVYEAYIPAQSQGTQVEYYLTAVAASGLETSLPAAGAGAPFEFLVATSVSLFVGATPVEVGASDPPYGSSSFASGSTVRVTATAHTESLGGFRYDNGGWSGTGSAPKDGTSNEVSFVIDRPSTVTWRWTPMFRLVQASTVEGIVNVTNWWPVGTYAHTVEAPPIHGGVLPFHLASWYLDGVRIPDETGPTANPVTNILMNIPRRAVAKYVLKQQNDDNDSLPDWWELYYFGSTSAVYNVDEDDDGFTNKKEYEDRTNPRDALSTPSPPAIAHVPLSTVMTSPAPWRISAIVTDNYSVVAVNVAWSRNSGAWQSSPMSFDAESGEYAGHIADPGITGDRFSYRVEATDNAALTAHSGPYSFDVRYPVAVVTPEMFGTFVLPHDSSTNAMLVISNAGHMALDWSLSIQYGGLSNDFEQGEDSWSHSGPNDAWHLSSARASSGTQSWFFGSESEGRYPDNANASLVTPPVLLSTGARLRFRQWLYTEPPVDDTYAWDACYVEISTNGGASFAQIAPVGGYNRIMFGHSASPFPDGTPCFVGFGGWEDVEFDLSAYALKSVQLGFRFGSDGYETREGWYIDDVRITPDGRADNWLSLDPIADTTAPGAAGHAALQADTAGVEPGGTAAAGIVITSNDPLTPVRILPVSLYNLSRVIRVTQPEWGSIVPEGNIYVFPGGSTNFTIAADAYYHIAAIVTNGTAGYLAGEDVTLTNFGWSNITANLDLGALIDPNLVTNGVPEWWLVSHGLTNAPLGEEATDDSDGDLAATWAEYIAGTDPTNAASVFTIIAITPFATNVVPYVFTNGLNEIETQMIGQVGGVVLHWPSAAGRRYDVEAVPHPSGPGIVVETAIPATPPVNVSTQMHGAASGLFYRLRVERE